LLISDWAKAQDCPDLSGTYSVDTESADEITVDQNSCKSLIFTHRYNGEELESGKIFADSTFRKSIIPSKKMTGMEKFAFTSDGLIKTSIKVFSGRRPPLMGWSTSLFRVDEDNNLVIESTNYDHRGNELYHSSNVWFRRSKPHQTQD
jgi:hypothetical protein